MSVTRESGLRLVEPFHEPVEQASVGAQEEPHVARDEIATDESSARAHRTNSARAKARGSAAAMTLSGVVPFAATKYPPSAGNDSSDGKSPSELMFRGTALYVSPATVEAIAKAKTTASIPAQQPREDSDEDEGLEIDGAPTMSLVRQGPIPLARRARELPAVIDPATPATRWQTYEELGLAPNKMTKRAQRLLISTYRLLGFGILTVIVVVLVGYIGTTAFYFLNHSWVTPVAISANDEKVVALQSQLAEQLNVRDQLVGELEQSERTVRAEQAFQMQFAKAIKRDLATRRAALSRVQQLASAAAATRDEIRSAGEEFAASSKSELDQNYNARLIDRDQALAGKFQLAQITSAKLSLAERQAEFDQRAADLEAQTRSLDAVLADKTLSSALSYDVLKIARDYEASKLSLARELGNRDRLKDSIVRQDQIIEGVKQSAYLRALAENATVALVPYDNLENATVGTALYACKLEMVWCEKVGKVLSVLPGEVPVKHPSRDSMARGRMIVMELSHPEDAHRKVLFAGRPPLGF